MRERGLLSPDDRLNLAAASAPQRAQRLRALGAIALVLAAFVLLWPSTQSLIPRWEDTVHRTYTHGYLIVAISLWLLWRGRSRWIEAPAVMSVTGAAGLLAGGVAWLIAYRAGLQIVHQALLPLVAFAAVLTCYGWQVARRMWLPIAWLYFAIPVWDAINPLLQWISVFAVRALLRMVDIPAFFADNTFQIPAGVFEIADGCSGLHFFVVAFPVAVLYGEINRDDWRTRIKLIALATALAMAANWLRIFALVVIGHVTQMQHSLITGEHYTFGWFVFAGTMLLFFLIVRRWPTANQVAGDAGMASDRAGPAIPPAGFALAIATLLLAPAWTRIDSAAAAPAHLSRSLPERVAGWQRESATGGRWRPVFKGADIEQLQTFGADAAVVEAYAAVYALQRQGKEMVGHDNSLLGEGFTPMAASGASGSASWREIQARDRDDPDSQSLFWYAYQIDGRTYSQPLQAQLTYAVRSLFGSPVSAVVIVRSKCATDCTAARSALLRFTRSAWPQS